MQTNYLAQQNLLDLANRNAAQNSASNRRRYSLGNFPSHQQQQQLQQQQQQQQNEYQSQKYSFLQKQYPSSQDMFVDQTNLQFNSQAYQQASNESTLSKYLLQQQQQQQQQQQNQENISSLLKFCSMNTQSHLIDNSPPYESNQMFFPPPGNVSQFGAESIAGSLSSSICSLNQTPSMPSNLNQIQNLQNMRRRASYCVGSSQLRPVIESRSSSPVYNPQQIYQEQIIQQQQQLLEQKLNLLASSAFLSPPTPPNKKLSFSQTNLSQGPTNFRPRASSMGVIDSSSLLKSASTGFTPMAIQNNKHLMENFEEKLATTGNIFQRREEWSILNKLPINKQNTMHIRLEDEGPFGNDETRCFVLSHLSSLCIKEMNCVFCSCTMLVYDRFPLVDGTMFVSPYMYDKNKSIPAIVSNKQQYLNSVCLDCINGAKYHEIRCKYCRKSWQSLGAYSLQIGNLYKYDIFAAFPCCQQRLSCLKCGYKLMDIESASNEFFSYFSDEKECPQCKTKSFHFIKPLKDVFAEYVAPIETNENVFAERKQKDDQRVKEE